MPTVRIAVYSVQNSGLSVLEAAVCNTTSPRDASVDQVSKLINLILWVTSSERPYASVNEIKALFDWQPTPTWLFNLVSYIRPIPEIN